MPEFTSMFTSEPVSSEPEPEVVETASEPEEAKPKQQRRKRKAAAQKRTAKTPELPDLSSLPAILSCLYTPKDEERDTLKNLTDKVRESGAAIILSPDEPNQIAGIVLSYSSYTNLVTQTTEDKSE